MVPQNSRADTMYHIIVQYLMSPRIGLDFIVLGGLHTNNLKEQGGYNLENCALYLKLKCQLSKIPTLEMFLCILYSYCERSPCQTPYIFLKYTSLPFTFNYWLIFGTDLWPSFIMHTERVFLFIEHWRHNYNILGVIHFCWLLCSI